MASSIACLHAVAVLAVHDEPERAHERVLGRLHPPEVVCEVHDAGHVGLGELDFANGLVLEGHGLTMV